MAHKEINGRVVVDWTTGDPEGDRIVLLKAYRDFIEEVDYLLNDGSSSGDDIVSNIKHSFSRWAVSIENQVDEVPRIWIKRPE